MPFNYNNYNAEIEKIKDKSNLKIWKFDEYFQKYYLIYNNIVQNEDKIILFEKPEYSKVIEQILEKNQKNIISELNKIGLNVKKIDIKVNEITDCKKTDIKVDEITDYIYKKLIHQLESVKSYNKTNIEKLIKSINFYMLHISEWISNKQFFINYFNFNDNIELIKNARKIDVIDRINNKYSLILTESNDLNTQLKQLELINLFNEEKEIFIAVNDEISTAEKDLETKTETYISLLSINNAKEKEKEDIVNQLSSLNSKKHTFDRIVSFISDESIEKEDITIYKLKKKSPTGSKKIRDDDVLHPLKSDTKKLEEIESKIKLLETRKNTIDEEQEVLKKNINISRTECIAAKKELCRIYDDYFKSYVYHFELKSLYNKYEINEIEKKITEKICNNSYILDNDFYLEKKSIIIQQIYKANNDIVYPYFFDKMKNNKLMESFILLENKSKFKHLIYFYLCQDDHDKVFTKWSKLFFNFYDDSFELIFHKRYTLLDIFIINNDFVSYLKICNIFLKFDISSQHNVSSVESKEDRINIDFDDFIKESIEKIKTDSTITIENLNNHKPEHKIFYEFFKICERLKIDNVYNYLVLYNQTINISTVNNYNMLNDYLSYTKEQIRIILYLDLFREMILYKRIIDKKILLPENIEDLLFTIFLYRIYKSDHIKYLINYRLQFMIYGLVHLKEECSYIENKKLHYVHIGLNDFYNDMIDFYAKNDSNLTNYILYNYNTYNNYVYKNESKPEKKYEVEPMCGEITIFNLVNILIYDFTEENINPKLLPETTLQNFKNFYNKKTNYSFTSSEVYQFISMLHNIEFVKNDEIQNIYSHYTKGSREGTDIYLDGYELAPSYITICIILAYIFGYDNIDMIKINKIINESNKKELNDLLKNIFLFINTDISKTLVKNLELNNSLAEIKYGYNININLEYISEKSNKKLSFILSTNKSHSEINFKNSFTIDYITDKMNYYKKFNIPIKQCYYSIIINDNIYESITISNSLLIFKLLRNYNINYDNEYNYIKYILSKEKYKHFFTDKTDNIIIYKYGDNDNFIKLLYDNYIKNTDQQKNIKFILNSFIKNNYSDINETIKNKDEAFIKYIIENILDNNSSIKLFSTDDRYNKYLQFEKFDDVNYYIHICDKYKENNDVIINLIEKNASVIKFDTVYFDSLINKKISQRISLDELYPYFFMRSKIFTAYNNILYNELINSLNILDYIHNKEYKHCEFYDNLFKNLYQYIDMLFKYLWFLCDVYISTKYKNYVKEIITITVKSPYISHEILIHRIVIPDLHKVTNYETIESYLNYIYIYVVVCVLTKLDDTFFYENHIMQIFSYSNAQELYENKSNEMFNDIIKMCNINMYKTEKYKIFYIFNSNDVIDYFYIIDISSEPNIYNVKYTDDVFLEHFMHIKAENSAKQQLLVLDEQVESTNFENKYLKYKNKYLKLKKECHIYIL